MIQVLFLFICTSAALPQKSKTAFGIFSGVSLNTNTYSFEAGGNLPDTSYSNDIKYAFNLGMFIAYDLSDNFGIKFQGQYTNKGGISESGTFYSTDLTAISRTYTNTINYFQFALLPQLNLPFSENTPDNKAYFNAGGYLSLMLSATENIDNETLFQYLNRKKNISNSISGTDAGLIFAAGIVYKGFLFDIRYDLGLSDITDVPALTDILSIKNRSINFSIGWTGGF
jgi:hypothetical protein